jgi:hypothetical protein
MAVLDTAIQEKPKHFNVTLDGRVKPGHDKGRVFAATTSVANLRALNCRI